MNKFILVLMALTLYGQGLLFSAEHVKSPRPAKAVATTEAQDAYSHDIYAYIFDIDGNLGFLTTPIMLWNEKTGKEKAVSPTEWALVEEELGKEGEHKDFKVGPNTFRFFSDKSPERGEKAVVEDIVEMLKTGKFGPSYEAFLKATATPESAEWIFLLTAREHHPDNIFKALQEIQKFEAERGVTVYLPKKSPKEYIFPVGWGGLDPAYKANGTSVSEIKATILGGVILEKIAQIPLKTDSKLVWDRDGTKKVRSHLLGFSDDDYKNYTKAVESFSKLIKSDKTGRFKNVKIQLIYTGLNREGVEPHAVIIDSKGDPRAPREEEAKPIKKFLEKRKASQRTGNLGSLLEMCQGARKAP